MAPCYGAAESALRPMVPEPREISARRRLPKAVARGISRHTTQRMYGAKKTESI